MSDWDVVSKKPSAESEWDVVKKSPGSVPSATVPDSKEQQPPSLIERGKQVLGATGAGAAVGAFSPEILTGLGLGAAAFPVTAPAAPFLLGAGTAARGARLAGMTAGAVGGAVGETGGQAVEMAGGNPVAAEATRFVGGMTTPSLLKAAATPFVKAGGYGLSLLANKITPGIGTGVRTLGQMLEERGVKDVNLSVEQRKFIDEKIASIRGGEPSAKPLQDVFGMLRDASNRLIQNADLQAKPLEDQAANIIREAEAQSGAITQQFAKRSSNLASQFESNADKLRTAAETQARDIVKNADSAATAIRDAAKNQVPELIAQAQQQADQITQQGRAQADQLIAQANQRADKLKSVSDRLRESSRTRSAQATEKIASIGQAQTPTELGTSIRQKFYSTFDNLRNIRQTNVEKNKTAAFSEALSKEQTGQRYQSTKAYQDALQSIGNERRNPETKLENVPVGEVQNALEKLYQQITDGKLSFEGLEVLRRSLRDRSSGLPAEGYDAIGQQQAGRLAGYVENIQREFSPTFSKYLEQYKIDSKPLNDFKTKVGQAMVGKEDFDFTQFKTDPATLGNSVFKTASTVKQLINVAGEKESEDLARAYLADKLRNAKSKDAIKKVLDDSRDWIGYFPGLSKQISEVADSVGVAKTVAEKRAALAGGLQTELGKTIPTATTAARRIEEEATKKATAGVIAAEREAGKISTAAEKEVGKVTTTAESQAGNVRTETERRIGESSKSVEAQKTELQRQASEKAGQITKEAGTKAGELTKQAQETRNAAQEKADMILGSKYDFERVRTFLLGGSQEEWDVISEIIKSSPQGKQKIADAVGQVIADRAETSLKNAIQDMRDLSVKLVDKGVMPQAEADRILSRLNEVFVSPVNLKQKTTIAQRLIRDAISGYAGARAGSAAVSLTNKKDEK